jgi:hypothetical protein
MRNIIVVLLMIIFTQVISSSRADSLSFKLPALKINQVENGKDVIYDFENSPTRFFVNDSFLVADPQKYKYSVSINDINRITIKTGTNVLPVMVLFFAVGGLLGAAATHSAHHSPTAGEQFIGAVVGGGVFALLAGGIALLISHDNDYMLSKDSFAEKRKNLIEILRKNKEK